MERKTTIGIDVFRVSHAGEGYCPRIPEGIFRVKLFGWITGKQEVTELPPVEIEFALVRLILMRISAALRHQQSEWWVGESNAPCGYENV
jgi:hypothetical protein